MSTDAPIQLFRPYYRTEETLEAIRECLDCGWTGLGFKTVEFEQAWKNYTGLSHAHFLNSASAALHLALVLMKKHYGWKDGDEVLTTPLTFVSTNHAIVQAGLRPVFVDVDKYLCLDPQQIDVRRTARTRAVMFVGLGGNAGQLREVFFHALGYSLPLIVDGAHMAGTQLEGQPAIKAAMHTACFSFQAVKNLPTADSGMLCFRDAELDAAARRWSWCGINKDTYTRTQSSDGAYRWRYDVDDVGFKYHGNSIMASMALVSLKYLEEDNRRRREIARIYDVQLSDAVERVPMAPYCQSSRHLYQVLVKDRDRVIAKLHERQVFPGVHYQCNTDFTPYKSQRGECPRAEAASARLLSLPMHLHLTDADASRVADAVNQVVNA